MAGGASHALDAILARGRRRRPGKRRVRPGVRRCADLATRMWPASGCDRPCTGWLLQAEADSGACTHRWRARFVMPSVGSGERRVVVGVVVVGFGGSSLGVAFHGGELGHGGGVDVCVETGRGGRGGGWR